MLTDEDRARIAGWLGYSLTTTYHSVNLLKQLPPHGQTIVKEHVDAIKALETQLAADSKRLGVTRVEDVHLAGADGMRAIRREIDDRLRQISLASGVVNLNEGSRGISRRIRRG